MAAQKQLLKPKLQEEQEIPLHNPQTSVKQSVEFLKKLTVVAISCISYLRNIFPPSAFTERKLSGVQVNIIKGDEKIPGTQKLIKWIKCAFDAVQLHILKKIILVIQKESVDTLDTLEVYTFNFAYNQEEISCQLNSEKEGHQLTLKNNAQEVVPADITKSVQQMIRSILVLTTTLQPLPEGCELTMKLEFNDEVPDNYKLPDCFQPVDSLGIHFPNECLSLKLGRVETKFTSLALTTKSVFNQAEDNVEEKLSEDDFEQSSQNSVCNSMSFTNPQNVTATHQSSTSVLTAALSQRIITSLSLLEKEVNCICELNDCNDIIECASCLKYQHRACYRLLEHLQVSRHICVNCHDSSDVNKMCTDPDLINSKKRKEAALYRRALLICNSSVGGVGVSSKTFVDHLGVTRQKAQQLINRLDIDGCLCPSTGKGSLRTVKTDHLKENVLGCNFKMDFDKDDSNSNMDTGENYIPPLNNNKRKRLFYQGEDSFSHELEHPKKMAKHLKYSSAQSTQLIK